MKEYFKRVVESFFDFGEEIVVAVSGGKDSMVMLNCLMECNKKLNLIVAHLNHCLRGQESDRDEEFVRNFCYINDLRFVCYKENIKQFSRENKIFSPISPR